MKRILLTALALTLLSGTSALAQDQDGHERRGPQEGGQRGGGMGRQGGGNAPAAPPSVAVQAQVQAQPQVQQPQAQAAQPGQGSWQGRGFGQRPQFAQDQSRSPQGGGQNDKWQGRGFRIANPPAQAQQAPAQPQAQPQQPRPQWQGQQGGRPNGGNFGDGRRGPPPSQAQGQGQSGYQDAPYRPGGNDNRYDRDGGRYGDRGRDNGRQGPPQARPPVIRPDDRRDRDYNRPRYDQRRYPSYVRPQYRYQWRGPVYRPPIGFYVRSWRYGEVLPWSWYTPNYYLNDWWSYGLPTPPYGCEWVRLGDDVALVDVFSGRIYQVVYNLFW